MGGWTEPVSLTFVLVTAAIAALIAVVDGVLLLKRRGTTRLNELTPAVDGVLVMAGFMACIGTGIAVARSAARIAFSGIKPEILMSEQTQRIQAVVGGQEWHFMNKSMVGAIFTVIVAMFLFFVFFEVWYLLRLLIGRYMKKIAAS